jgi:hypothetical protein
VAGAQAASTIVKMIKTENRTVSFFMSFSSPYNV